MRRYLAPLFTLVTVLATSCGGSTSPDVVTLDQGVGRLVANAAEQSAELESMRFSVEMVMGGLAELDGDEAVVTISGATTADGARGELTMNMSGMTDFLGASDSMLDDAGLAMLAEPVEIRYTDGRVYMSSSFLSLVFPVDTPWITFEDTSDGAAAEMGIGPETVDPEELMVVLRGLGDDAEIVGNEEIDGVATTHVRGRFSAANVVGSAADLEGLEEMLADLGSTASSALDDAVIDVDVWIGDDGIVRRLRFAVDDLAATDPAVEPGASMTVTMDLFDVGAPVEIVIPPADQVTDFEEILGGAFFS